MRMILLLLAFLTASPAAAQVSAHSGLIDRHGFELSDVALFAFAVIGVWLARRALRARFRRDNQEPAPKD